MLPAGFLVSRRTQDLCSLPRLRLRVRVSHPLRMGFPAHSPDAFNSALRSSFYPASLRFGLVRFRSPLLTDSLLISLPTGTQMFHFPASRSCGAPFVRPAVLPS